MRLTVQEIRSNHFNRKMRGYDPVEVEAFLELIAQELESAQREATDLRGKLAASETALTEYKVREKTLQEALKHGQEAAQQITDAAHRQAELLLQETQLEIEREKQRAQQELMSIQEESVKLRTQKDHFLRRMRHMLRAEEELIELLSQESPLLAPKEADTTNAGATPESNRSES